MLLHIVKNNERIEDILNTYHISLDEIKKHNAHLTDYDYLASGTKLRIPIINEEVEQILDSTESFVMDYYPQIEEEISKGNSKDVSAEQQKEVTNMEQETSIPVVEQTVAPEPLKIIDEQAKESIPLKPERQQPNPVNNAFNYRQTPSIQQSYYYPTRRAYPGVLPPRKPYGGRNS